MGCFKCNNIGNHLPSRFVTKLLPTLNMFVEIHATTIYKWVLINSMLLFDFLKKDYHEHH
jgi:hypothetical protein